MIRVCIGALNFSDALKFPDIKNYVFFLNVNWDFIIIILRMFNVSFLIKSPIRALKHSEALNIPSYDNYGSAGNVKVSPW